MNTGISSIDPYVSKIIKEAIADLRKREKMKEQKKESENYKQIEERDLKRRNIQI